MYDMSFVNVLDLFTCTLLVLRPEPEPSRARAEPRLLSEARPTIHVGSSRSSRAVAAAFEPSRALTITNLDGIPIGIIGQAVAIVFCLSRRCVLNIVVKSVIEERAAAGMQLRRTRVGRVVHRRGRSSSG